MSDADKIVVSIMVLVFIGALIASFFFDPMGIKESRIKSICYTKKCANGTNVDPSKIYIQWKTDGTGDCFEQIGLESCSTRISMNKTINEGCE